MKLIGANADLGTEAKLGAVGKPRGCVDVDRRRVDRVYEALGKLEFL